MNTFELLWFLLWLGCGGVLGYYVGHVRGMIAGAGVGFAAMYLFARILVPHPDDWPVCVYGATGISSFSIEKHAIHSFVHRCNNCGALYLMRKGNHWDRVLSDGTTELSMTRRWPGRWKSVQVAVANHDGPLDKPLQPPAQKTRRG